MARITIHLGTRERLEPDQQGHAAGRAATEALVYLGATCVSGPAAAMRALADALIEAPTWPMPTTPTPTPSTSASRPTADRPICGGPAGTSPGPPQPTAGARPCFAPHRTPATRPTAPSGCWPRSVSPWSPPSPPWCWPSPPSPTSCPSRPSAPSRSRPPPSPPSWPGRRRCWSTASPPPPRLVILWRYLRGEGWREPWYAWTLVACATGVSVALNVAHAPDRLSAQLFAALPPVALLGALELLMSVARTGLPHTHRTPAAEDRSGDRDPTATAVARPQLPAPDHHAAGGNGSGPPARQPHPGPRAGRPRARHRHPPGSPRGRRRGRDQRTPRL